MTYRQDRKRRYVVCDYEKDFYAGQPVRGTARQSLPGSVYVDKMEMNKKTGSGQRRNTILLIAAILLLAGAGWLIQRGIALAHPGVYAVVQYQGKVYERLDLSKDTELLIDDGEGNYNRIVVKDGQVAVTEANCPDQVCVYTYPINVDGGVIACLPHSLVIYMEGDGEESGKRMLN